MPFHLRLGKARSQQYNVSAKEFVIPVELLDQSTIECTLSATSTGQECLDDVCQRLGIQDCRYFGFLFRTKQGAYQWLDVEKPVKKQLDKLADSWRIYLKIQFFVPDIDMLCDDISRSHYYLQLKTQFIEDRLKCSHEEATRLAAYSLQSEFGDYQPETHTVNFLSNFALLPRRMTTDLAERDNLLEQVLNLYRNLHNIQPGIAEIMYITEAQQLDGYGQEGFPCKDLQSGRSICLGVSLKGIFVVGPELVGEFKWKDIANLIHQKKVFTIDLNEGQQKNYMMANSDLARYTWRICVAQHKCSIVNNSKSTDQTPQRPDSRAGANSSTERGFERRSLNRSLRSSFHDAMPTVPENNVVDNCLHEANCAKPQIANGVATLQRNSKEVIYDNTVQSVHIQPSSQNQSNMNGGALREPAMLLGNITTVQVHHEPPFIPPASSIVVHESEIYSNIERPKLPPYKCPPNYEAFIMDRRKCQNSSAGNVSHYSNTGPKSLPVPIYNNVPPSALPYYIEKPHYPPYENVQKPYNVMPRPSMAHIQNVNRAQHNSSGVFLTNSFAISSPDLHAVNFCSPLTPVRFESVNNQRNPLPYYMSVPDLSGQYRRPEEVTSKHPSVTHQIHPNHPAIQVPGKFPCGSEPNLPESEWRYSIVSSNINQNSRHLSIDTLNNHSYQRQNGHPLALRPAIDAMRKRDLTVLDPQTVGRLRSYTQPYANIDYVNGMGELSTHLQQVKEENAYANIDELRASIQESQNATHAIEKSSEFEASIASTDLSNGDQFDSSIMSKPEKVSNGKAMNDTTILSVNNISTLSTSSKDPRLAILESKLGATDLLAEFDLIPRMNPQAKYTTALQQENLARNRFRDILPYESNRVKLPSSKDNRPGYINGSLIQMNYGKNAHQSYIAAQGPLMNTVNDFWRMIWTQKVNVVVMVTELTEDNQEKCFLYFPQNSEKGKNTVKFGEFTVSCNFIVESSTFVTSSLTLSSGGNSLSVWHIRYTDWCDHTCPEDVQGFLSFLEGVDATYRLSTREGSTLTLDRKKKKTPSKTPPPPIVVHCSAGVGRSGVVILCDIMVRSLDSMKELDVPKALTELRYQRMNSVQNFEQYKFVYRVLAQYLRNSRLI
ncbi:Tyrosine-protein phosphatase non-receptor type 14 [Halotydeus destructor]|nr:Tyrosine-protein phosphatase non-receptor type 14 [Halotydeus destructor]